MKRYVLIVSGGAGSRLQSDHPKQFLEINGLPLIMHTFHAFSHLDVTFVLVLPESLIGNWEELCRFHNFNTPHKIKVGGPERFHSVKSGLKSIPDHVLVAIHDGVRPLASKKTIDLAYEMAEQKGNAVPAIGISDSVRQVDGALNRAADRNHLKIIQTPQVFHSTLIKKAYNQNYNEGFTDDATVLESIGYQIHLTKGNPENIKITHPTDLLVAGRLLSNLSG